MIIIGNGIAGKMASSFFSNFYPKIYESKESGDSNHKAIMRFRDPNIGYLLGVSLKKVSVTKSIYYDGSFVNPNPKMLNLYSRKVAKGIYKRSISSMEIVDRYIAQESFHSSSANYGYTLKKIRPHICYFSNGEVVEYDVCISTIPLPVIANAAGIETECLETESYPIYILRGRVNIPSNVYQTIYFPDQETDVYRASLEAQELIIECQSGYPTNLEIANVCNAFGLLRTNLCDEHKYQQDYGKIIEMDDSIRKRMIMELTEKFSVYSLGRYATWRNITSDVLLDDLPKIAGFMKLSDSARKYSMTLESVK
jgi:hypothetical protein